MYRYAKPRRDGPVHRVHVDGGVAFKHEPCNLDDAAYFRLEDERPEGRGCLHCKPDSKPTAEELAAEKSEERVPALGKNDVPKGLTMVPTKLLLLGLSAVAALALLAGSASGVVLSPDDERGGDTGVMPSPTASCDPMTLEGCGDLVIIIEKLIDEQLLDHLLIDHAPEVSPSPTIGVSPSPSNTAPAPSPERPSPTGRTGSGSTTGSDNATPRPRRTPTPTARPVPTAAPSPTPCFRPGNPKSGKDPCGWPVDDH